MSSPKVTVLIGAASAYACIRTESRNLDVQLKAGCSAHKSLRESAAELRREADERVRRAELMDAAATELEIQKTPA